MITELTFLHFLFIAKILPEVHCGVIINIYLTEDFMQEDLRRQTNKFLSNVFENIDENIKIIKNNNFQTLYPPFLY